MTVVELKENIDPSYYRLVYGHERNRLADMFEKKRPSVEERLAAGKALVKGRELALDLVDAVVVAADLSCLFRKLESPFLAPQRLKLRAVRAVQLMPTRLLVVVAQAVL